MSTEHQPRNDQVSDSYLKFAPFYDVDTIEETSDLPFWLSLARRCGGPILEVAAGTGRILLPLARAGFQVVGVDVSRSMLDRAKPKIASEKLGDRIDLVEANGTSFSIDRRFSLAFVAFNSFGHFVEPGEAEAALRQIRRHLVPAGTLALDLPNPEPTFLGESGGVFIHEFTRPGPRPGWTTLKTRSQRVNPISQIVEVTCLYDEVSPEGELRRTIAEFTLRYFHRWEIELLLNRCGFTLDSVYGSYDLDPLTSDSSRLLVLARANGSEDS